MSVEELEAELAKAKATIESLRQKLDYYNSRPQMILDRTAEWCLEILQERPTAAELNVITKFLKDQNVLDLKHGGTPVYDLAEASHRPFPVAPKEDEDFGTLLEKAE